MTLDTGTPEPDIRVDATRAIAEAANDPVVPLPGVFEAGPFNEEQLTELCLRTGWKPDATAADEALLEAARALVNLLPLVGGIPHPNTPPELGWAPLRVFFAGLGHEAWSPLVAAVTQLCAECPWTDEPYEEWHDAALDARRVCGWPLALAALPYQALTFLVTSGADFLPLWAKLAAGWHIVRHLRRSPRFGAVVTHRGASVCFALPGGTSMVCTPLGCNGLAQALGIPPGGTGKARNPFGVFSRFLLTSIPVERLCARKPRHLLPGAVLTAPWSRVRPVTDHASRWWHHGLTLEDVFAAIQGRVYPASTLNLAADDIIGYDWHVGAAPDADPAWAASIPATYTDDAWPSELLRKAFPNLEFGPPQNDAILDAVLLASVLRPTTPSLLYEYPLVLALAGKPEAEFSTNNGKSLLSKTILHAMSPGAQLVAAPLGASAPQRRALLQSISADGTLGLDEWRCALGDEHVLNREALQALCTGGRLQYGLVLNNEPHYAQLRHSLVANAKAAKLSEDLITRTLFLWVDPLTDEQRANAQAYQQIVSGQLATQLRLAAVAKAANYEWQMDPSQIGGTAADGLRFNAHRHLAAQILCLRYPQVFTSIAAAAQRIDAAASEAASMYRAHTAAAYSSGLMAELAAPSSADFALDEIFDATIQSGLTPEVVAKHFHAISRSPNHGEAGHLLDALTAPWQARGLAIPAAVAEMVGEQSIKELRPRAVSRRFLAELNRLVPEPGTAWPFPGAWGLAGWRLTRCPPSSDGRSLFQLDCTNPNPPI